MTDKRPDWQRMNAFVDGELTPDEAAAVARAIAENRDTAGGVAALARLKSSLRESVESAAVTLPPAPRRTRRITAVVAVAALLLVALAGLLVEQRAPSGSAASLNTARDRHDAWVGAAVQSWSEPGAGYLLAALQQLERAAHLPDLSDACLRVSHVALFTAEQGKALHVGYRGTRGCMLSLFALPAPRGAIPIELPDVGARPVEGWLVGDIYYLLLADSMDPDRFRLIAKKVKDATRDRAPFDRATRTALAESRARSRPCRA